MRITRTKWFMPLFAVALGVAFFAAQWVGGSASEGLVSLGIMVGFGALVLLGGRSETVRGLRGDGRDERFRMIDHSTRPRSPGDAVIEDDHRRLPRRGRARSRRHAVCLARRRRRRRLSRLGDRAAGSVVIHLLTHSQPSVGAEMSGAGMPRPGLPLQCHRLRRGEACLALGPSQPAATLRSWKRASPASRLRRSRRSASSTPSRSTWASTESPATAASGSWTPTAGSSTASATVQEMVQIRPEWDKVTRRLALHLPDGTEVAGAVELGEPVDAVLYGRPHPSRRVVGPWQEALSADLGRPLELLAACCSASTHGTR